MNDMGTKLSDLSQKSFIYIFWFINIRIVKERTGIFNQADTSLITGNIDNSEKLLDIYLFFATISISWDYPYRNRYFFQSSTL